MPFTPLMRHIYHINVTLRANMPVTYCACRYAIIDYATYLFIDIDTPDILRHYAAITPLYLLRHAAMIRLLMPR